GARARRLVSFTPAAGPAVPILVIAFVLAAAVALVTTPFVRTFVRRQGLLDHPSERRVNRRPLPRGGGVAVVIAFVLAGGGLTILDGSLSGMPSPRQIQTPQLFGLFGGAILAALIGVIDDALDLRARWQLIGQIAVALVAVVSGITFGFIGNPF